MGESTDELDTEKDEFQKANELKRKREPATFKIKKFS